MDKKYIGTNVALSKPQLEVLEHAVRLMERELDLTKLSRAVVIERALKKYIESQPVLKEA